MRHGERHFGEYKNLSGQTDSQLGRSIKSYAEKLSEHRAKLLNPHEHDINWDSRTEFEKKGAMSYWEKEVRSFEKKLAIAKAIAEERGL